MPTNNANVFIRKDHALIIYMIKNINRNLAFHVILNGKKNSKYYARIIVFYNVMFDWEEWATRKIFANLFILNGPYAISYLSLLNNFHIYMSLHKPLYIYVSFNMSSGHIMKIKLLQIQLTNDDNFYHHLNTTQQIIGDIFRICILLDLLLNDTTRSDSIR